MFWAFLLKPFGVQHSTDVLLIEEYQVIIRSPRMDKRMIVDSAWIKKYKQIIAKQLPDGSTFCGNWPGIFRTACAKLKNVTYLAILLQNPASHLVIY